MLDCCSSLCSVLSRRDISHHLQTEQKAAEHFNKLDHVTLQVLLPFIYCKSLEFILRFYYFEATFLIVVIIKLSY